MRSPRRCAQCEQGYSSGSAISSPNMRVRCIGVGFSGKYAVVVWRNVHVARPSCSTSGGHPSGGSSGRVNFDNVGVGDPFASADMIPVVVSNEDVVALVGFCEDFAGGAQFRNAVQILHGFPSGPITIPGGSLDCFFGTSGALTSPADIVVFLFAQEGWRL